MSANEPVGPDESAAELWRKRLAEAERNYRNEMQAFVAATGSEKSEDVEAAARRRDEAREEFHRLLRIFSDLVIRGRTPGEP
jgi:hypothetical protein